MCILSFTNTLHQNVLKEQEEQVVKDNLEYPLTKVEESNHTCTYGLSRSQDCPSRGLLFSTVAELGARWGEPCAGLAVWWRGVPSDWGDPVLKAFPSASLRFSVWGETPGRCVLGWARAAVREGVCASDVPVAGLPVSPSRSRERNAVRRAAVSVCRRRPRSGGTTGVGGRGETLAAVGSRSVAPWVRSGGVLAEPRSVGGGAEGDGAS